MSASVHPAASLGPVRGAGKPAGSERATPDPGTGPAGPDRVESFHSLEDRIDDAEGKT